jgi:hypothetical protein
LQSPNSQRWSVREFAILCKFGHML